MKHGIAFKALLLLAALFAAVYAADWVQFHSRGAEAVGNVSVRVIYEVRHKDGKTEFLIRPPESDTCAHSLFFRQGYTPCWYLRRHRERRIEI